MIPDLEKLAKDMELHLDRKDKDFNEELEPFEGEMDEDLLSESMTVDEPQVEESDELDDGEQLYVEPSGEGEFVDKFGDENEAASEFEFAEVFDGNVQEYVFSDVNIEREIVGKKDTRVPIPIKSRLAVPYRWICALDFYFKNPNYGPNQPKWIRAKGTGVLIGECHVLTSAHNLYHLYTGALSKKKRLSVKKIIVTPARYGSRNAPFGSNVAEKWKYNKRWNPKNPKFSHDFGIVKLKDAIGLKRYSVLGNQRLGWWGKDADTYIKSLKPKWLKGRKVWCAGYPGDKCGKKPRKGSLSTTGVRNCRQRTPMLWASHQWIGSGRLTWVKRKQPLMAHTIDTYDGQSGAPVWYRYKNRRWLVGLHVANSSPIANLAVRVRNEFVKEVERLMKTI